ncbi:MAG TPA: hypothetical protein VFC00_28890 [Micromonosporaceae bacterium]|nr:hypothetical protein [Micromonosporaceae bacterium]
MKTVLEMIVGIVVVVGVVVRAGVDVARLKVPDESVIFHVVAGGLAVVAAIELAYTLFTPGPDEVVNPLMLGLSSAFLFGLSVQARHGLTWGSGLGALLFVASLAGLFVIRRRFVAQAPVTGSELDALAPLGGAPAVERSRPEENP